MKNLLLLICCLWLDAGFGQAAIFSPAQIVEDAEYLHAKLKSKHPHLYLYTAKDSVETFFKTISEIQDSLTALEFYNKISLFSDVIKDGHTLLFPSAETLNFHNNQSAFFPFKLFCDKGQLFVEADYSSTGNLEPGSEILSMNDVSADSILQHCLRRLMRDGYNLNYPVWILNNYFSEYYSYFFGHPASYTIKFRSGAGIVEEWTIPALVKSEILVNRTKRYGNRAKARGLNQTENDGITIQIDSSSSLAILTIRDFDSHVLKRLYQQDYSKSLKAHFSQIRQSPVNDLILDLRGNQGGDLKNGILLLSLLMPEPFQVVERFAVVGNSESEDMNARNKEIKGNGTRVFKPQPDAYSGNLYLLVDGGSFSNSGIVASAIRHYRRGVIIGEETGGNEKVLCGYESLTVLPNTRLQVYIPTRQFVIRDMPGNEGRGVIPDFIISPSIQGLISGKDEVLEYCIGLIKGKQGLK
jgi:hypothetical protein